jgi:hypothetical protein
MKLYGASDLHSNNNVTVLIDEKDKVVYQKRLANDLALVIEPSRRMHHRWRGSWWSRPTTGSGWSMV